MSRRGLASWAISLSLIALPSTALAEPSAADKAAAQGLFDEARALMEKSSFAKACPMLEESNRLDPGQGTLYQLARCYEGHGRVASAWTLYVDLAEQAKKSGNAEREKTAKQRADAVFPRIPKLKIEVADAISSVVEVKRDGTVVGKGQFGVGIPVDPGARKVTASAPGRKPFELVVQVKEAEVATAQIPDLAKEDAPPAAPVGAPPKTDPKPDAAPPHADKPVSPPSNQRTYALVLGGVGVVGVVVGSVFGLQSKSKHDSAKDHCDGANVCDQEGVDLRSSAKSAGNLSTVFFAVGVVGIGAGTALWLTAPNEKGARVVPAVGPGVAAVSVAGRF